MVYLLFKAFESQTFHVYYHFTDGHYTEEGGIGISRADSTHTSAAVYVGKALKAVEGN